ncbi:MAG: FHA domain-containing protein [Chloroflexi bacterium]|nr:FHA domain-containing protein [Chloroflexota bacterium]
MYRLIMRRGPTPGAIYELEADEVSIGRGRKNDIIIHDNEVSKEHCRLLRLMNDYEVRDQNSAAGTFVNGQRVIGGWLLQPGSLIELGDTITLEYERTHVVNGQSVVMPSNHTFAPATPVDDAHRYGLMMTQGPALGHVYMLSEPTVSLGRDLNNDIVVQDPEISRQHLRLYRTPQGYLVEDLHSTNGTFINGERLKQPHLLQADDVIRMGTRVQLQFMQRLSERPPESVTEVARPSMGEISFGSQDTYENAAVAVNGQTPGALLDHIFVAYARDEWEKYVAPLVINLEDAGLHVWVDQYMAEGSDEWRHAVELALEECWLMVLVVSPQSLDSNHVKMEYRYFQRRDKPIIPLVYEQVRPYPGELSRLRAISYDAENARRSFHKLIFEIMQRRNS